MEIGSQTRRTMLWGPVSAGKTGMLAMGIKRVQRQGLKVLSFVPLALAPEGIDTLVQTGRDGLSFMAHVYKTAEQATQLVLASKPDVIFIEEAQFAESLAVFLDVLDSLKIHSFVTALNCQANGLPWPAIRDVIHTFNVTQIPGVCHLCKSNNALFSPCVDGTDMPEDSIAVDLDKTEKNEKYRAACRECFKVFQRKLAEKKAERSRFPKIDTPPVTRTPDEVLVIDVSDEGLNYEDEDHVETMTVFSVKTAKLDRLAQFNQTTGDRLGSSDDEPYADFPEDEEESPDDIPRNTRQMDSLSSSGEDVVAEKASDSSEDDHIPLLPEKLTEDVSPKAIFSALKEMEQSYPALAHLSGLREEAEQRVSELNEKLEGLRKKEAEQKEALKPVNEDVYQALKTWEDEEKKDSQVLTAGTQKDTELQPSQFVLDRPTLPLVRIPDERTLRRREALLAFMNTPMRMKGISLKKRDTTEEEKALYSERIQTLLNQEPPELADGLDADISPVPRLEFADSESSWIRLSAAETDRILRGNPLIPGESSEERSLRIRREEDAAIEARFGPNLPMTEKHAARHDAVMDLMVLKVIGRRLCDRPIASVRHAEWEADILKAEEAVTKTKAKHMAVRVDEFMERASLRQSEYIIPPGLALDVFPLPEQKAKDDEIKLRMEAHLIHHENPDRIVESDTIVFTARKKIRHLLERLTPGEKLYLAHTARAFKASLLKPFSCEGRTDPPFALNQVESMIAMDTGYMHLSHWKKVTINDTTPKNEFIMLSPSNETHIEFAGDDEDSAIDAPDLATLSRLKDWEEDQRMLSNISKSHPTGARNIRPSGIAVPKADVNPSVYVKGSPQPFTLADFSPGMREDILELWTDRSVDSITIDTTSPEWRCKRSSMQNRWDGMPKGPLTPRHLTAHQEELNMIGRELIVLNAVGEKLRELPVSTVFMDKWEHDRKNAWLRILGSDAEMPQFTTQELSALVQMNVPKYIRSVGALVEAHFPPGDLPRMTSALRTKVTAEVIQEAAAAGAEFHQALEKALEEVATDDDMPALVIDQ